MAVTKESRYSALEKLLQLFWDRQRVIQKRNGILDAAEQAFDEALGIPGPDIPDVRAGLGLFFKDLRSVEKEISLYNYEIQVLTESLLLEVGAEVNLPPMINEAGDKLPSREIIIGNNGHINAEDLIFAHAIQRVFGDISGASIEIKA